jgi:integrase
MNNTLSSNTNFNDYMGKDVAGIISNCFCKNYTNGKTLDIVNIIIDFVLSFKYALEDFKILSNDILKRVHSQFPRDIINEDIITILKITLIYLHMNSYINLSYENISHISNRSNIIPTYLVKAYGFQLQKLKDNKISMSLVTALMLKNKISDIELIQAEMIFEFRNFSVQKYGLAYSKKYSRRHIDKLHMKLFLLGIVDTQPKFETTLSIDNDKYYAQLKDCELKKAILWYLDNLNVKPTNISKFKPFLLDFGLFVQREFGCLPLKQINRIVATMYCDSLSDRLNNGGCKSKNWAYLCIVRINAFFNFIAEYEYYNCNPERNIFAPNRFRTSREIENERHDVPSYILEQMLTNSKKIDEYTWAIIKVYVGTGMRINELGVLSIDDFHENALSLINCDAIMDKLLVKDICWVKVTAPKIKSKERIVLIDRETYNALMILKEDRFKRFGDIPKMLHPKNPQLGLRDYLILSSFSLPYASLVSKILDIFKALNLVNHDGTPYDCVPHQLRHTYETTLYAYGCPLHFAMSLMGHEDKAMHDTYNHFKDDVQDITLKNSLVKSNFTIDIQEVNFRARFTCESINKIHNIKNKYVRRGGYCGQDEFQDDCSYIDCIECPIEQFKSNYTFREDLKKSMIDYYADWDSEEYKATDRAIHYLYLARLFEKLYIKVNEYPDELEVQLAQDEINEIANEVGL